MVSGGYARARRGADGAPSRRTFLRGTAAAAAVLTLGAATTRKHRTGIYQATYTATY